MAFWIVMGVLARAIFAMTGVQVALPSNVPFCHETGAATARPLSEAKRKTSAQCEYFGF
jgi:hypothetical protein